ncbi:MBL fold metallo-hydrolase [Gaopeijia maritima]|uniref:MBL fold metallo-hydrolase n=1 Tax=Gaopeijia maritima TaxID=3119007 RepID=A0ABU9E4Z3_9BACT
MSLRRIRADNPGPFTLDGSVTYILGRDDVVILDPGPDVDSHIRALVRAVAEAERITVVLTHGHGDHAGGMNALLAAFQALGRAPADLVGAGHPTVRPVAEGEPIPFDGGHLEVVPTPGHTRDHLAWYWPQRRALFAGDHLLGVGDTTWVGEYPGCVADYLASLDRLRTLDLDVVHPGHGPDLHDPADALDRFERHRRDRIEQVRTLREGPDRLRGEALYDRVYGGRVPPGLDGAARASLAVIEEYLDATA